jgi:hypothetical protein
MREVPVSYGFLAFFAIGGKVVALRKRLRYFAMVFNASCLLVVTRRDMDATWQTLGSLCRERDWSKHRLLDELRNGLPYRTTPLGHAIDWHHPDVERSLDVAASEVTITRGVLAAEGEAGFVLGLDRPTVGIEVLPPSDVEVLPPLDAEMPMDAPAWAFDTVRDLRKIPVKATKSKAALARFLAAESKKDAQAGRLRHALKASYIENWLGPWGIWPLTASE